MSWAKVKQPLRKPIGWWWHKIFCELGYWFYERGWHNNGMDIYYYHLNKMCKEYGFNLYGDKI